MNQTERRRVIEQEVIKCSRCGTCRSICPVFLAENNENTTARSKNRMMEAVLEGDVELTPGVQERFEKCLLCKACKAHCGSGVATDKLIMEGRAAAVAHNGLSPAKKMAFTGLRYRKLFDLGLRTGALFQNLIFKKLPDGRGCVPRILLPGAGLNQRRIMPNMTTNPLRSRLPKFIKAKTPVSKGRVLFFTGCMLNYMYPEPGEAVVSILTRNGWDVVIPEEQCCCGTPAFTSGDVETGRFLAEQNIKAISAEKHDHIVTACASCGAALKHEYKHILDNSSLLSTWQEISTKVLDISQFVLKYCDLSKLGKLPFKVTYHDPCHLVRGMNVSSEPREILKSIPGLKFVEMKDANRCCGAGGSFSAVYYELSRKINDKKLDNVEDTGMDYLVTGCSSCRMHITDGLTQRNSSVKVLHTAEVINMAYDAASRKEGKAC
ncbi:Lactate utilization protein A [bioreactor metagenome]|uniref:Lactate utilization protein A n=1 Tax=bioreactor metagenome TaxID=1076179 RepID=A0A644SVY1_9ZZZZ|nr:(Fe-S)-binding protein [Negativicutes bacterium]